MARSAEVREPADPPKSVAAEHRGPVDSSAVDWVTVVAAPDGAPAAQRPVNLRRVVVQMAIAAAVVGSLVGLAGTVLSRRIAESESVHDVAQRTDILAESVVQPALTDAMATDIGAAATLDGLIRERILSSSLVRVKLWSSQGAVLYSDESRLVGRSFILDEGARSALTSPQTKAEVSDLRRPENAFERSQGKLLEVYRPVWTPSGREVLFESYYRYDVVTDRSSQLWRGFVGITLSSVAAVFVLLVPIMWTLLRRTRRAQAQRETMMQRALDASGEERQRIAAALHDGLVQELAAASFAVAGGAEAAAARGDDALAGNLRDAAATVRTSMGGLRSLVVDIYPPSLRSAGLSAALSDMTATLAGRSIQVRMQIDEAAAAMLTPERQQAVFRVAQECLRNTVKHAAATAAELTLKPGAGQTATLQVSDNGRGFLADERPQQHLGISLMSDVAASVGARLDLRTGPGQGTTWRLQVPTR
ncbi:MAG TPA: ATP-binding protein [Jatrophihabitantaceae bacterium]|jgi:signal transduction histidine kinase